MVIFLRLNDLLLIGLMVPIAVIDYRSRRIPNRALIALVLLRAALLIAEGALLYLNGGGERLRACAEGAACALGMAALLLVMMGSAHRISPSGLGMGDVKLCGALGFCLPPLEALSVLLLAMLFSTGLGSALWLYGRIRRSQARVALAFAPQVLAALLVRITLSALI